MIKKIIHTLSNTSTRYSAVRAPVKPEAPKITDIFTNVIKEKD
jgi:hypothetical protein